MKRKRFTEEQIIGILREHEAGMKAADLARKHVRINAFQDVVEHKGLAGLAESHARTKRRIATGVVIEAAKSDERAAG